MAMHAGLDGYWSNVDICMMDMENAMLSEWKTGPPPKGPTRCRHPEWAAHVKALIVEWYGGGPSCRELANKGMPHHKGTEVSWDEYASWVEGGGGDEFFM